MTNKQKVYSIIMQRKMVTVADLEEILKLKRISILKSIYLLICEREIKYITLDKERYFLIKKNK
jgi:hypothetical protein